MTQTLSEKAVFNPFIHLQQADPDIYNLTLKELARQQQSLELIASENFTSLAVMQAMGTVLTNKYAEGQPGKRYYGGCDVVDEVENLAIQRAKQLFGCDHVNVQPHSGAQANLAAFLASGLKPGDTFLGMDLSHGGHLTHGSPVNISGLYYNPIAYGINPTTGELDMADVRRLAELHRPKLIICGASAYPRVIDFSAFRVIADSVGAVLMADIAHIAGLVASGLHPSPIPHCHLVTTTTHKTLRGPRGGIIMSTSDYAKAIDKAVFPGTQGGPLMHVIAAKAVAFKEALSPEFLDYNQRVLQNAKTLASTLKTHGVNLLSDGTDNHLMVCDLRSLNQTGKVAQARLESVGITANKNTVPNDPQSPFVTSGIRLGTPALTTRGLDVTAMEVLGQIIATVLKAPASINPDDPFALPADLMATAKQGVADLCQRFPLYPQLGL
jgi:glycine hydroxymethyltransferase